MASTTDQRVEFQHENNNGSNNTNGRKINSNNNSEKSNGLCKKNANDELDPITLIPELCNHFYHLGWASGTGGGLSIRQGGRIYCAPSGVNKERIKPEDMFILNEDGEVLQGPLNPQLKCSECLSLFMVPFKLRDAGCCIHSHSINANLITALYSKKNLEFQAKKQQNNPAAAAPFIKSEIEFRISNQEMIKGIKKGSSGEALKYTDTLVVPIIDNVLYEKDLAGAMYEIVVKYPQTNSVLVRNHGVYVWGKTWQQAKTMAECYDYLFKLKLEALRLGFDWMLHE